MKLLKFAFAKNNIFENKTIHKNFTVLLYLILACSLLLGLTNALPIGKFGSLEVTYDNQNLFFKAQLNSLGYLGIGFTKDSHKMENTDMIIMIIGKDKSKENTYTCSVLDYYSEETYPVPDNELEPPGTNDIKNVKFTDEKKDEKKMSFRMN